MNNSRANNVSEYKPGIISSVKIWFLKLFRLTNQPLVRVYRGFGNGERITVMGHAFRFSPISRKHFRKNWVTNFFAVIRLFMVRPYKNARVSMEWEGTVHFYTTESDGFFRFELENKQKLEPGLHEIEVKLHHKNIVRNRATARILVPDASHYAMISDIDDTFLISHSSNFRKKLFVLLTENAHTREPFEGVVEHYRLLASISAKDGTTNPFFFVSSSEWNLYDYIREFFVKNDFPQGVYLLNQLKTFSELWKTGSNNHSTKFTRIVRILEYYPDQKFILLGDDTQEDPIIYESIVSHFPGQIKAVYIRKVRKKTKETVVPSIEKIKSAGVQCCYFSHSEEAMEDTRRNIS